MGGTGDSSALSAREPASREPASAAPPEPAPGLAPAALVAWLRAPASAPNALLLGDAASPLARLTLAPLLFVALAGLAILLVFTTEIYVVNGGIGDDGMIYAAIIRAYDGKIQALGLNGYTAQRCLSPILVRLGMNLFKVPFDSLSIIKAYKVANSIALLLAIGAGIGSALHLRLSRAGLLVAVLLTYFNFATLYWVPWDPVLTDCMALAVGSLQLYAYLSRRYVVLAVVSAIGGFIWPSSAQVGAALLFFPRPPRDAAADPTLAPLSPRGAPTALDSAVAAVVTAVVTWYAGSLVDYVPPYGQLPAIKSLFRLSCAILCLMTFVAMRELVRVGPSLRQLVRRDWDAIMGKVLALVMLGVVSKALKWIAVAPTTRIPQAPVFSVSDVLKGAVFFAVQRPLIFVVAHVGFFGPAILLLVFFPREVLNGARRLGAGLNAVLGMAFLMMLNSQSRGGMDLMPIVLPLAAVGAARAPWTPKALWQLGMVTFVASKLWYTMVQKPAFDFASIMFHVGPWMAHEAYIGQGIGVVLAGAWLLWLRAQRPAPGEAIWLSEEQPGHPGQAGGTST